MIPGSVLPIKVSQKNVWFNTGPRGECQTSCLRQIGMKLTGVAKTKSWLKKIQNSDLAKRDPESFSISGIPLDYRYFFLWLNSWLIPWLNFAFLDYIILTRNHSAWTALPRTPTIPSIFIFWRRFESFLYCFFWKHLRECMLYSLINVCFLQRRGSMSILWTKKLNVLGRLNKTV